MSAPERHGYGADARHEQSDVVPHVRTRRRARHRARAIAAVSVLLSGVGVGAAYGVTASATRAHVPEAAVSHPRVASVVVPVTAPALGVPTDLEQRVAGLVVDADRIVSEKREAERKAAEDAERAAWAAKQAVKQAAKQAVKQSAAADASASEKGDHDGGCSGTYDKP